MAAYAALVSLMNTIQQIQNHPRLYTSLQNSQIVSLAENLGFLLDFVESYDTQGGVIKKKVEDLKSLIASAAHEAEDVIESHTVDQIFSGSTEKNLADLLDLQKMISDMDKIKKITMKFKGDTEFKHQNPTYSVPVSSSRSLSTGMSSMVGFDSYLIQLMDVLTGHQSGRLVVSISGMGGTGKTTLGRNIYEHMVVLQHFDIRSWATISQEYSVKEILLELLSCKDNPTSKSVDKLGEELYKKLCGKRYLLILDDMWSIEVWDQIKPFLPDNGTRSRIVVTSRQSNMDFQCSSYSFKMNFLDEDDSWKLFCEKVFEGVDCPPELVETGKKIVEQCGGLPLSIVVIGGHLRKSSRSKEVWENVASDIKSILNSGEDGQCLDILSLSYDYLPAYLKPCFLFMGIFREDREIHVSRLIKLWVAEGFLRPNEVQSLEEIAEGYLKDLVDRNLILVSKWSRRETIKACIIHDLLRELCLKVGEREKFLCVLKLHDDARAIDRERRVAIHGGRLTKNEEGLFDALRSAPLLRSLSCNAYYVSFDFLRLLRVLTKVEDSLECKPFHGFPDVESKFKQVNLRYLDRQFNEGNPIEHKRDSSDWHADFQGWILTHMLTFLQHYPEFGICKH